MSEQEAESKQDKTEPPSHKRLEDAMDKGEIVHSREVNNFLILGVSFTIIIWLLPYTAMNAAQYFKAVMENIHLIDFNSAHVVAVFKNFLSKWILIVLPILLSVALMVCFSPLIQNGQFVFTTEPLKLDLKRISIISGFEKLFSKKNILEIIKSLLKLALFIWVIGYVVLNNLQSMALYQDLSFGALLLKLKNMISAIFIYALIIIAVIAILDYWYSYYSRYESLKMSRKDLKDEHKEFEGNPEVKSKLKSKQRMHARQRMMAAVPNATVVITNPEHYAVALEYTMNKSVAPKVVAKGMNLVALKIRTIAEENRVPIIENPPVARALYKDTEIGEMIPSQHYRAVAKILSYVYNKKKNKRKDI